MLLSHKVVNFLGFCFLFLNLRLCLFWVKSISRNAFPYLRVFGCARKMHFPEMLFSWPLNGCKLISVSILPSNSHFPENTERAEWEGERERVRERKNPKNPKEPDSDRRPRPRRTPKPIVLQIVVPDRIAGSSSTQIVVPDHVAFPENRSSSNHIVVLDRDLACHRTQSRSQHQSASEISLVVEPSRDWIMNFFFFSGCYLCFWIKEWDYNICLAAEKIWENVSKK